VLHYAFIYHVAIDWKIWYFKFGSNWKKYARLCKNIVRSQLAQYSWGSFTQFWGFPSSCCCEQGTPD